MKVLVEKPVEPVEKAWGVNLRLVTPTADKCEFYLQFPDNTARYVKVADASNAAVFLPWLTACVEAAIEQCGEIGKVYIQDLETEKEMLQLEYNRLKAENKSLSMIAANAEWRDANQELRAENTQLQTDCGRMRAARDEWCTEHSIVERDLGKANAERDEAILKIGRVCAEAELLQGKHDKLQAECDKLITTRYCQGEAIGGLALERDKLKQNYNTLREFVEAVARKELAKYEKEHNIKSNDYFSTTAQAVLDKIDGAK